MTVLGETATAINRRNASRLERVTRLELATSSLARRCSTTELHPQPIWRRGIISSGRPGARSLFDPDAGRIAGSTIDAPFTIRPMSTLHHLPGLFALQVFTSAFFAILFLQSSIDKLVDRRGNLEWLTGHFAKSPLGGSVPVLLFLITILELSAGALSAVGCVVVLIRRDATIAFYGAVVSGLALLALFFGQRLAKDYPGAAALVPYILVVIAALIWLGQG